MWKQVQEALNESATAFITRLASLLPGFVALLLALLISLALAWIVAVVARRLLSSVHFDEWLARWGFVAGGGMVAQEEPHADSLPRPSAEQSSPRDS